MISPAGSPAPPPEKLQAYQPEVVKAAPADSMYPSAAGSRASVPALSSASDYPVRAMLGRNWSGFVLESSLQASALETGTTALTESWFSAFLDHPFVRI